MLSRYDIVLVALPFSDGPGAKLRPAMGGGRSESHQDVLLAFNSSKGSGEPGGDELDIPADHGEFSISGLKVGSRMRPTMMATLAENLVRRRIDRHLGHQNQHQRRQS